MMGLESGNGGQTIRAAIPQFPHPFAPLRLCAIASNFVRQRPSPPAPLQKNRLRHALQLRRHFAFGFAKVGADYYAVGAGV